MATILAVEDNESVREELADILRFEGYEVTEAGNGREGLECIRQRVPDLVLCDLMMPEMDGYETLRRLRAEPEWAAIPFVCLTASTCLEIFSTLCWRSSAVIRSP